MRSVPARSPNPDPGAGRWSSPAPHGGGAHGGGARGGSGGRLNLLLSYGGWRDHSWADDLPRLLEPLGVAAWRAKTAREAAELIDAMRIHAAVVDLRLPMDGGGSQAPTPDECGARVLQLLQRLEAPPPTVVVRRSRSTRDDIRETACALRAGAFAVVGEPIQLETMLRVLQRLLERHYADRWPDGAGPTTWTV